MRCSSGARLNSRCHGQTHTLYLHGGGFVIGSLETHDSLCRQLARRSGGAVVALDYRLAPEHRFPAAQDDAWAALRWLGEHGATLGLDTRRLAVGGDSAGGTLAAVAAIQARNHGLPLALQLLITPGTAALATHASRHLFANGFLLDAATIDWFFEHAIDRSQRHDWRFAPLEADDLGGVAPACVMIAECDPLADEGVAYADKLRLAGVPVNLDLVRGMTHDFIKMGRVLKEAGAAQQFAAVALTEAWSQPT
jgi:acetyl esterase